MYKKASKNPVKKITACPLAGESWWPMIDQFPLLKEEEERETGDRREKRWREGLYDFFVVSVLFSHCIESKGLCKIIVLVGCVLLLLSSTWYWDFKGFGEYDFPSFMFTWFLYCGDKIE